MHAGVTEAFGDEPMDRYDGEIRFTDEAIGRLLDQLEELELADDTIVVLFADHGEEFRDHGGLHHGDTLYAEQLHVPLAIRVPGLEPRRVAAQVRGVDVLPTVLELLDLPSRGALAGESLVPALRGEPIEHRPLLAETRLRAKHQWDAYSDGEWKLCVDRTNGRELLFHVAVDPRETRDVAAEHPEVVERLFDALVERIAAARERAGEYGVASELELSAEDVERLRGLGYIGGEE